MNKSIDSDRSTKQCMSPQPHFVNVEESQEPEEIIDSNSFFLKKKNFLLFYNQ